MSKWLLLRIRCELTGDSEGSGHVLRSVAEWNVGSRNVFKVWVLGLHDRRDRSASKGPYLHVDERALGVDGICDLLHCEWNRLAGFIAAHTSFHLLICSSLQMPGAFVYPPACGEMKVASDMRRVPGVLPRWA